MKIVHQNNNLVVEVDDRGEIYVANRRNSNSRTRVTALGDGLRVSVYGHGVMTRAKVNAATTVEIFGR